MLSFQHAKVAQFGKASPETLTTVGMKKGKAPIASVSY